MHDSHFDLMPSEILSLILPATKTLVSSIEMVQALTRSWYLVDRKARDSIATDVACGSTTLNRGVICIIVNSLNI